MMVLVGWVIAVAPIGVFALAAPLAARMGFSAAGALLSYIMLATILTVVVLAVLLYPATVVFGGVPWDVSYARARRRKPSRCRRDRRWPRCPR